MKVDQIARYYGNQSKAAEKLGYTRATISIWKKRGVPLKQQYRLERITAGKLRAERP